MGVIQWFQENVFSNTLMMVFLIAVIGYLVGSIKICGLELGAAGILLVARVFGHFGVEIPDLVRELGLICFVTSVGFIAGPKFFRNFKSNAASYILLGILVIAAGGLVCVAVIKVFGIPTDISVGMMTGALTSTPGLAAALEEQAEECTPAECGAAFIWDGLSVPADWRPDPAQCRCFSKAHPSDSRNELWLLLSADGTRLNAAESFL